MYHDAKSIDRAVFLLALTLPLSVALTAVSARVQGQESSGQQVVEKVCTQCHATGVDGAPKIGDSQAWGKRTSLGLSSLTQHALQGIRKMPAHGGHLVLSDLEIARAITNMVNRSGGHWVEPASAMELATERSGEQVVKARCVSCHEKGLNGAPKIADQNAWAQRLKHGLENLTRSAIHGHGGMPPRGGQANLTDAELQAAILYMYNPASAITQPATSTVCQKHCGGLDPNHKSIDGIEIYLGFIPAQKLHELPAGAPERTMHGGIPKGSGYYHVNVSLYDTKTGSPIKDAHVMMRFERPGLSREVIELEPMAFSGGSYGNYLKPQAATPYRVTLQILVQGIPRTVTAKFASRSFE